MHGVYLPPCHPVIWGVMGGCYGVAIDEADGGLHRASDGVMPQGCKGAWQGLQVAAFRRGNRCKTNV